MLRSIFRAALKPQRQPPMVGARYQLNGRDYDPWGLKQKVCVTVVDCKDGWVRYRMDGLPCDDAKPLKDFTAIYDPENES